MNRQYDLGIIGIGVMGRSLALNFMDHGITVSAYNRDASKAKALQEERPDSCMAADSLPQLTESLKKPRRILLMVPSGKPVDDSIVSLKGLLDEGDIIMDGGNSFFRDTIVREANLKKEGILFFGVGVSGGEEGARKGPCIMPGGDRQAYEQVGPLLESIAAKKDNEACCTYIGPNGAGHYVKMVHNGIEYADMQLIAESYLLLKQVGGLSNADISRLFHEWNQGELKSFLIGITADIFAEDDDEAVGKLVDKIVDSAGQKGTGRWTSIQALKQGVNISLITAACNARVMSNLMVDRHKMAENLPAPKTREKVDSDFLEAVRRSLYIGKIAAYAQGFALYRSAAEVYHWNLDFGRIAAIFRAGCIIQADFLNKITEAYQQQPELSNLMRAPFFASKVQENIDSLRKVASLAIAHGVPVPALVNAVEYIDAFRNPQLGANLIQAQRDYFGAHTYARKDKKGAFHHEWHEHYEK